MWLHCKPERMLLLIGSPMKAMEVCEGFKGFYLRLKDVVSKINSLWNHIFEGTKNKLDSTEEKQVTKCAVYFGE